MTRSPSPAPLAASRQPGFAALGVPASIVAALDRQSITEPFPIQSRTLPDSLAGRDILARGVTGSGKTLAFAIPTVMALAASGRTKPGRPRALILVPTRELAAQVAAVLTPLAAALRLSCATVFGGVAQSRQVAALRSGVDILIACPGRLEDLIAQRACSLADVQVTVLDEADHMVDLGFLPAVRRLLDATPDGGQRMLFSATLDNSIDAVVRRYLHDPRVCAITPAPSEATEVVHHLLAVTTVDKGAVVREVARHATRAVLFTRTKRGAQKLAGQLRLAGIEARELHGNLSQPARQRNLGAFADGSATVLVATDIAARGIHVDNIDLVLHVDPPMEHKAYVHRSGRTARAGATGVVATLMTPDQASDVHRLTRAAGITATMTKVTAAHPLLASLSVSTAPAGEPRPAPPHRPSNTRSNRPRRRGREQRPAARLG
ncbi:MAG TPA: DEAD/DEAH box helicase [Ilumatobacteraceae bacterium]|nr:DEAD/DEAH box helicase [Ilumatobacteraceae bacterium]